MQKRASLIVLPGRNTVLDALSSGQRLTTVMVSRAVLTDEKIKKIESLCRGKRVGVEISDGRELDQMAEDNQGVIGLMEPPEEIGLKEVIRDKKQPFVLLFNRIDYEQNLGAILRTAWAAGVDAIVVNPSGVHEITPVVAKVSMGGAAYVPLISQGLFQALDILRREAIPVIGVEVDMGKPYYQEDLTGPVALLFGGEEKGLSEPLIKYTDKLIHIPMKKEVASLNVSVATAVVLFERARQVVVK